MRHGALAHALGHPHPLRTYVAAVIVFDEAVYVRARSPGRARAIMARSFEGASWGTFKEGLQSITSLRIAAPEFDEWPLVYPLGGPEGLVRTPGGRP